MKPAALGWKSLEVRERTLLWMLTNSEILWIFILTDCFDGLIFICL